MADIVFGFASSHGPLLVTEPDKWDLRANYDRRNPAHPYRGGTYTFDELYELRKADRFEEQNTIEVRRERHDRNQKALDVLAERVAEVDPDILVLVGDDQHEWFHAEVQPAFTVFCGEGVTNVAFDPEEAKKKDPGTAHAMPHRRPERDQVYPCPTDLGRHIVETLIEDEFDVTASEQQPQGPNGPICIGHAVGFIYRRILKDKPLPLVPILLNTFYPPNQPTPKRCLDFGRSVGRAIQSWDGSKRVAICASGGLSHFVIDEDFDHRMIDAMKGRDFATMAKEPQIMFRSGTSETKNWLSAIGALDAAGLTEMDLVDYVPCYRSEAGTGNAMGFATWS